MSRGLSNFETPRLQQVLAARRLSQLSLAQLVGVSPSTVSKWCNGLQAPEPATLERLAEVVNVEPEWFTRPLQVRLTPPLYRSTVAALSAAREMFEARATWGQELALALAEYVDFPNLALPACGFTHVDQIDDTDIESATLACRDLWKLGRAAIPDLALALEGAGVILIREETGVSQIEGLSTWSPALARPIVYLSADKDNGYRSRFDLAHELGHLVLHKHVQVTGDKAQHALMEQQAHRFAGAFLLPAESFTDSVRTPASLDSLLLLKRRWGVSVAAMIMRLNALEIVGNDEKQALFKRRSARWGAKSEPYDGDRSPETPRLLRRSIELLVNNGVIPLNAMPHHFGLAKHDIEMLTGLPKGYFNGPAQVIELATLRHESNTQSRSVGSAQNGTVVPFIRKKNSDAT